MKLPKDSLALRTGQFELDLPFTQARTINLSPYDIYQEANIGAAIPGAQQQNVNNQFSLGSVARGIELSGGHLYGGYHYSVAVFDQNTTGVSQAANLFPYVPSATASANGGVGFSSDSGFKNIYARASYRFNLESDPKSRHDIQAAGKTGPHDHTYLNLGTFYMDGDSLQRLAGATVGSVTPILNNNEPYYRVGGDFSFNYRTFNVYGSVHVRPRLERAAGGRVGRADPVAAELEQRRQPPGSCAALPQHSAEALCKRIIWCSPGS